MPCLDFAELAAKKGPEATYEIRTGEEEGGKGRGIYEAVSLSPCLPWRAAPMGAGGCVPWLSSHVCVGGCAFPVTMFFELGRSTMSCPKWQLGVGEERIRFFFFS